MGNLEYDGVLTRWIRLCIGLAILSVALAPLVLALGKSLHWLRWW